MKKLQQGDVIIRKVALPEGAKLIKLKQKNGAWIIAKGEATGHAHVLDASLEAYEKDGVLYLKLLQDAAITHEEHKPISIPMGDYQIGIVREFDPWAEEIRKVRD